MKNNRAMMSINNMLLMLLFVLLLFSLSDLVNAVKSAGCLDCKIIGKPVSIMYARDCSICGGEIEGDYSLVTQIEVENGLLIGYEYCTSCTYASDVIIEK